MALWMAPEIDEDPLRAVIVDGATIGYVRDLVAAMDHLMTYGFARLHAIAMTVGGDTTATAYVMSTAGIKGAYRAPQPQPASHRTTP